MRNFVRSTTALFGALLVSLSKADTNLHIYEVRHPDNYLPATEQARSVDGVYGRAYQDGRDNEGAFEEIKDGDGTIRKVRETAVVMVEVERSDNRNKHVGGEHPRTTIKTTIFETASVEGLGEYKHRTDVQMSYITTTVFEKGPGTTVTVTPEVQLVTQMVTVTAPGTTITEAGACSQTGLASAAPFTTPLPEAISSSVIAQSLTTTVIAATSTTNSLGQAATTLASISIGSSGQVAQGTGSLNSAGYCDCQCLCNSDSFPSVTYASMGNAPALAPTTLQTLGSASLAASTPLASTDLAASGATLLPTTVISAVNTVTTSSLSLVSSSSSTISATSSSSTSYSSIATATIASSSASVTVPPNQSTVPAQGPNVPFNISTLSLSSALILGSLGAHATPSP